MNEKMREEFELRESDHGRWPKAIERSCDGDGYVRMQTHTNWLAYRSGWCASRAQSDADIARLQRLREGEQKSYAEGIADAHALIAMQAGALNELLGRNSHSSLYDAIEKWRHVDFDSAESVAAWEAQHAAKVLEEFADGLKAAQVKLIDVGGILFEAAQIRAQSEQKKGGE